MSITKSGKKPNPKQRMLANNDEQLGRIKGTRLYVHSEKSPKQLPKSTNIYQIGSSPKEKAIELWDSCIHSHIGAFTLTQEKRAIELIEKKLKEFEEQTRKEIEDKIDEGDKVLIDITRKQTALELFNKSRFYDKISKMEITKKVAIGRYNRGLDNTFFIVLDSEEFDKKFIEGEKK